MNLNINLKDVGAGLAFLGFALAFGIGASHYNLGTAFRMGPAYFPILVSLLLGTIGVVIIINGLRSAYEPLGKISPRSLILILGSPIVFALTIRPLGLVPAIALVAAMGSAASKLTTARGFVLTTVGLTAFSWLVFVQGLGVSAPIFGPLVPILGN